ncbi:MAG: ribosome recycling factor [Microgenomates group bacterium LiPW_16]|nr:MAG: ribosome recycling factor [Microgenomates group bacterium LiPW_16]
MDKLLEVRQKMGKALEVIRQDLATIRTGRATPALVENVILSVYEGTQKLKMAELATISTSDPRTLVITPFDPSIIEEINKGILEANIGLTPAIEGQLIRITIPPLSEERRQEYIKLAKSKLEAGRIMIRQIRHDFMSDLKRKFEAKEISEDDRRRQEKDLQELTDKYIAEIDDLGRRKEEELLQV